MPLLDATDRRPLHFIGIAGAGMSGLAELCVRRGAMVTGCDANPDGVGDLERAGIPVARGHDPAHLDGIRGVVVSSAIPRDLPEVVRARALGLPVIRRAEALGEAVAGQTLVAIAGTHGKTTTTVMTTEALAAAGMAPTGVAGGRVGSWHGNLRFGSTDLFVVEADEYDRSFLALTPTVAVVTNVEADHLDIYTDLDDIQATFAAFLRPARWVVLCADDAGARSLAIPDASAVLTYGATAAGARLMAAAVRVDGGNGTTTFDAIYDGVRLGTLRLRVPGMHNVRNALAALAVGCALGVRFDAMAPGLEAFTGVTRRFERIGEASGVIVIDDYAHHPTEIRVTIAAARAAYPERRVLAAFQPHLFSRTRDFATAFGESLAYADAIFLADIYPARERAIPGVTADLIAAAAAAAGQPVAWRGGRSELAAALARVAQSGDVILTLGAGDITQTGAELLRLLDQPGRQASPVRRTA